MKRQKRSHNVKDLSVSIPSHNKILEAQINHDVSACQMYNSLSQSQTRSINFESNQGEVVQQLSIMNDVIPEQPTKISPIINNSVSSLKPKDRFDTPPLPKSNPNLNSQETGEKLQNPNLVQQSPSLNKYLLQNHASFLQQQMTQESVKMQPV